LLLNILLLSGTRESFFSSERANRGKQNKTRVEHFIPLDKSTIKQTALGNSVAC